MIRAYSPHPCGAAVAMRQRCLALLRRARLEPEGSHPSDPNRQKAPDGAFIYWRRERDSNPRWAFNPYSLSRGAPSATRPPLRDINNLILQAGLYPKIDSENDRNYSCCALTPFGPLPHCPDIRHTTSVVTSIEEAKHVSLHTPQWVEHSVTKFSDKDENFNKRRLVRAVFLMLLGLNAFIDLFSMYGNLFWRIHTYSYLISLNTEYGHCHFITDHQCFTHSSRKY
jgi:hypothetical protein